MPAGRPREYDRIQVAKDFVEYVKTHEDCLTIPCFSTTIGITSDMMMLWANEDPEFRSLFNLGRELIGVNRLRAACNFGKDNDKVKMDRGVYMKCVTKYDSYKHQYEREQLKYEYDLKSAEQKQYSDELVERQKDLIAAINRFQK